MRHMRAQLRLTVCVRLRVCVWV